MTAVCWRMPVSSMSLGPRVELWALQRVPSLGPGPRRGCSGLKGHKAQLVVIGPGHESRDMRAMAALAVRLAGSDQERIRDAAGASSSAALLKLFEDNGELLVLVCQPLDMAAMAPLSRPGLHDSGENLDLALLLAQPLFDASNARRHR